MYVHISKILLEWEGLTPHLHTQDSPDGGRVIRDNVTQVYPHNNQRVHRKEHVSPLVDLPPNAFHAVPVPHQNLFPPNDPLFIFAAGEKTRAGEHTGDEATLYYLRARASCAFQSATKAEFQQKPQNNNSYTI